MEEHHAPLPDAARWAKCGEQHRLASRGQAQHGRVGRALQGVTESSHHDLPGGFGPHRNRAAVQSHLLSAQPADHGKLAQ